MASNYVKKYECGKLGLDLPYANCIYELPLLAFGDMRGNVNLSLIYNREMNATGGNPFNINNGYKLNIQKRIFFNDIGVAYYQEANGKIVQLYDENGIEGVYSFFDDSQRIIRLQVNGEYILEYPDYSTEKYNSSGKITEKRDKYGDKVLTYRYTNGMLTSVIYREGSTVTESKEVVLGYDENSRLESIGYSGNGTQNTTVDYSTSSDLNQLFVTHYSGVNYSLFASGMTFSATISGTEGSKTYTYRKKCNVDSSDECTLILSDWVGDEEINRTQYKYPDLTETPYVACNHVDITDYLGAKTRVQFSSEKTTYSYEIGNTDTEFFNGQQYIGKVDVFRTEDDLFNAQTPYTQRYYDGVTKSPDANGNYNFDLTSLGMQQGYFIISGWAKPKDGYVHGTSNYIKIKTSDSDPGEDYYLAGVTVGKWMYFTVKASASSNFLIVTFPSGNVMDIKDLRITFQSTHVWSQEKTRYIPIAEDVLINKSSGSYIALKDVCFSAYGYNFDVDWSSFDDILRYVVNKKKNINTSEFYYSKCKTVVAISPSADITFGYRQNSDSKPYRLNDYYLGKRIYSHKGIITTKIKDDESGCFLLYQTLDANGNVISSQSLNNYLDVVSETSEGVTSTYTRDKGLVTSTNINGYYSISTAYDETNGLITQTDAFGKQTKYRINKTWGAVEKIELADDSAVSDTYDGDKSALLSRSFEKNQVSKTNEFGYAGGNVASLTDGTLSYTFDYTKGDLTKVSKGGSPIVEHQYTPTQASSFYPYNAGKLYSIIRNYDKYGRLSSVNDTLTNVYSLYPVFDQSTGDLVESTHVDNSDSVLAMTTDNVVSEVSRYSYNNEKLLTSKSVTGLTFSNKISDESFSYDSIKRPTSHTYNCHNGSDSVSSTTSYTKSATDPLADNRVYSYTYNVNGTRKAYTYNNYDGLKRLTEKNVTLNPQNTYYKKTIAYNKTRVSTVTDKFSGTTINTDSYSYDNIGRIVGYGSSSASASSYSTYGYDEYGRLIRENNNAINKTLVYSYDGIGNISSVKSYNYTTGTPTGTPTTTSFGYSADRLTSFKGKAITYNANGEVATYDGWNYTWSKGKLSRVSTSSALTLKLPSIPSSKTYNITYNALGQRVGINYTYIPGTASITPIQQGEVTEYSKVFYYDHYGRLISETNSKTLYGQGNSYSKIVYLYDESSIIGMVYTADGVSNTYYYLRNLQGDVIGIYNTTGTMIVKYNYDAWGNCTIASGTTDNILANANPIRYRGYHYDADLKLYYLNARYYSPEWRRFISPDDTAYLDPETPNGLNLYAYCNNDPVMYKQSPVSPMGSITASSTSTIVSGGIYNSSRVSSSSTGSSKVNWENGGFQIPIWISSLISGSDFGASIAPASRTIYQYIRYPGVKDLNKLYGLDFVPGKLNIVCSVVGYGLLGANIGLSAWSNFTNENLTTKQQWIGFGVDTSYILGTFSVGYGVGVLVSLIPGVGVLIAPFVSAGVTWFIDFTNERWDWLDDVKQWFNDL